MSPSVTVRLLATQSDARLVELARQGHERAFEALVQRHRRPLLAYCRRALLPDARAEDALQQALLQAWLALQRGDDVRDARAWLYRIVRNTALNALRGSGYDYAELSEALSGADAPHEDLDRRIAVREALAGLAALPAQQREALLRTAVEGATHADAAAQMGVSESALRGLVYRARATLRTAVTAITPMPLATWAAGAAGHGGGAVAELAVGGGSAGLAGLLLKGGAVAVTAGVLAAGAGSVERRHAHDGATGTPRAARVHATPAAGARTTDAVLVAATPVAGDDPPARRTHARRPRHRRRAPILAPVDWREHAPEVHGQPRVGGRGEDDGGESPRRGWSGGGRDGREDGGEGPGPGGRLEGDGLPGSGPVPASGDERRSGDRERFGGDDDPDGDGDRGGSGSDGGAGGASGDDGGGSGSGESGTSTGEGLSGGDGGDG